MAGFNFGGIFGLSPKNTTGDPWGVPPAFIFSLSESDFIKADLELTYSKILTDCLVRTHGLPEEADAVLWDSCVQSEAARGLVSLLACAMTDTRDLFLVYKADVKILREATQLEAAAIRKDYEKSAKSDKGVFVSFKKLHITPMLRIYSALEHASLASLHKTTNLSKAIQYKIKNIRSSVSLVDSGPAIDQARGVATALGKGQDIMTDAEDMIETAQPNLEPTKNAIAFLQAKRAYILNMPLAYVTGEQAEGMGTTGEADMRSIERGLLAFFHSVVRPTCAAIFNTEKELEFRSQDFRDVTAGLEVLKTFDLVSDENMSRETKQEIVARFFELDVEAERKRIDEEAAAMPKPTPPQAAAQPAQVGAQPPQVAGQPKAAPVLQ